MRRKKRALVEASVSLMLLLLWVAPTTAQTLHGRVLEDGRDRPVAGASVSLLDRDGKRIARVDADTLGRFTLVPPRAGEFVVEVAMLGYETTRSPLLALVPDGDASVDFLVRPLPIGLEGLSVSVESEIVKRIRSYGLRPESLGRRWMDRESIEAIPTALRADDVIRWQGVPGAYVQVPSGSPGLAPLCVGFWRAKSIRSANPPCSITFLNDARIDPVEANQITPEEIEAIAVLTPVEATTLYGTQGGAGAVLIWTRRGGR